MRPVVTCAIVDLRDVGLEAADEHVQAEAEPFVAVRLDELVDVTSPRRRASTSRSACTSSLVLGSSPLRLGTLFFDQPGFGAGIQVVLWACVGLLALTFVLSALLPRRAREEVSA